MVQITMPKSHFWLNSKPFLAQLVEYYVKIRLFFAFFHVFTTFLKVGTVLALYIGTKRTQYKNG